MHELSQPCKQVLLKAEFALMPQEAIEGRVTEILTVLDVPVIERLADEF